VTPLSPYAATIGIVAEDGPNGPELRLPFVEPLLGRPGFLHGGMIAGLLEYAASAQLRHALGTEQARIELVTITVDYLRAGLPVETFAAARAIRIGGRIANLTAEAWQDDRHGPIATARINLRIFRDEGKG
jgi:acyl-coenzyme A thioesterase PaaI-like protein